MLQYWKPSLAPLLVFGLVACSGPSDSGASSSEAVAGASSEKAPSGEIVPSLVQDPGFTEHDGEGHWTHWRLYQHAGDTSYTLSVKDGIATIERVGIEPWGQIRQAMAADALVGKTLEWSVELSGDLNDSYGEPFQATGLWVSVMGFGTHDLPMMGARHLLTLYSDPGLSPGPVAPARQRLRFVVPEGSELQLEFGVVLTHGGQLHVRAPQLTVVEEP